MTKHELKLLLIHENFFEFYFDRISQKYENMQRVYSKQLADIDYLPSHNRIPEKLYKFISFDDGLKSIENTNLQFSHPLSFRDLANESLKDRSEFWFDRFYIDRESLYQIKEVIEQQHPNRKTLDNKSLFLFLIYNHTNNLLERNKVLCLTKSHQNDYMWEKFQDGICIEYNTDIFKRNELIFPENDEHILTYNAVEYVDLIEKYPIRINGNDWLSNLIFVKNRGLMYSPLLGR